MKSGLDNKRNVIVLVVLLAILAACVWYFVDRVFVGGASPAPAPKAASSTEEPAGAAAERAEVDRTNAEANAANENGHAARKLVSLESLDPTLHPELMAGAEALEYSGDGRNIFSMNSAPVSIPRPLGTGRNETAKAAPPQPTGPPPPPPIDLTFFGYERAGNAKKALILHGDDVFIASEGEVVDHHYKVLKITPLSIQVTDLLYNNTQTLTLAQS
ncbi:MAG TPA: hypothetical protein VMD92_19605 [Acidobacteriaceae bacterium]|nr:hypothetical protein [Acidobacteriaceae bacterium]